MARITEKRKAELIDLLSSARRNTLIKVTPAELTWIQNWKVAEPPVAPQTAPQMLHKAASIMEDRAATYDQPEGERSMGKTVAAFNIVTGMQLKESDGWYFMEMLKNVRQYQNPAYHQDSAEDGVAYSSLKAEALEREQ